MAPHPLTRRVGIKLKALVLELSNVRAWRWTMVTSALWLGVAFLGFADWSQSWREVSVWIALPSMHATALIAAASADSRRTRLATSWNELLLTSGQRALAPNLMYLLATWVIFVLVPTVFVSCVISVVALISGVNGFFTGAYVLNAVFLATIAMLIGFVVGTWLSSRIFAPIIALLFGLGVGLNLHSVPPANPTWITPNWSLTVVLMVLAIFALAFSLSSAALGTRTQTQHRLGWLLPSATVLSLLAMFFLTDNALGKVLSVQRTAGATTCEDTALGTTVCIWAEDEKYLNPLLEQAERLEDVLTALDIMPNSLAIAEPGISVRPESTQVVVEPLALGPGLWLTAESMAYAAIPINYDFDSMSEEEIEHLRGTTIALTYTSTSYIFEGGRPKEVRLVGYNVSEDGARDLLAEIKAQGTTDPLEILQVIHEMRGKL